MRVAVVGLGVIGNVHIESILDLQEELVAVCDIDVRKLSNYPKVKGYVDYVQMLEEIKPDTVHICTPHYLHAEMIITALNRGVNVLCEKPLCICEKDIARIKEAENNSKAQLGVCHQNRYNDVNVYLKNYLADKEILSAHGTVAWKRDQAYYAQASWRGTCEMEGGGVLINQALHTLDLLQWLCGRPRQVVSRIGNFSLKNVIEVEDTACMLCVGEKNFTFFATNASGCDMDTQLNIKLTNNETIVAYPQTLYINGQMICKEETQKFSKKCCYGNGHKKLFADFYDCVLKGKKFGINGEEASKVIKIILSAYKSNGEEIQI